MAPQRASGHARGMKGTIICAVDDSNGVGAAVEVARRLADRFDARMLLVSVSNGVHPGVAGEGVTARQARAGAETRLRRLVVEHQLGDEEHRVAAGDPAEAVAAIAAEEAADLIVIGAKRRPLGRALRSTLASELAATASCPVVVVPPESAVAAGRT
jgi:nucleotide-binding universal stress UspA family protein